MNFCFYHMNQSTHSATHRVAIFVGQTLASGDLIRRPLKAPGGRVQRETIDEFEPFPLPFFSDEKGGSRSGNLSCCSLEQSD